jgi:hypothetical protein
MTQTDYKRQNADVSNENARDPKGLWRLILEDLSVRRPSCSLAQNCSQPLACAVNRLLSLDSEPDSPAPVRLPRPPVWLCCRSRLASSTGSQALSQEPSLRFSSVVVSPACSPVDLRPAPPICLPAPPSVLNSRLYRLLRLRPSSPTDLRLAPPINYPAVPSSSASGSHRLPHPSGSAFRSTFGFRLQSTIPLRLRNSTLRPSPVVVSPARLSGRVLGFRFAIDLQGRAFRLSVPALTSCRISGLAVRLTFGFRLRSALQLRLRTQPPTNCVVIS